MKTITLRLTAPLQSYGNQATFNYRTSTSYPTKSAIIGILAAALGYSRDDNRISKLNDLRVAVRVDQPGTTMTDFQTVRYSQTKGAKLTYRDYLQDAVFMVAIGSPNDELVDKIVDALHFPIYQLYLGRRSNPPAGPLEINVKKDVDPLGALTNLEWQASDWFKKRYHSKEFQADIIADADLLPDHPSTLVRDKVGSFSQNNRYHQYRPICETSVELKNPFYKPGDTNHDIMSFLSKRFD